MMTRCNNKMDNFLETIGTKNYGVLEFILL